MLGIRRRRAYGGQAMTARPDTCRGGLDVAAVYDLVITHIF